MSVSANPSGGIELQASGQQAEVSVETGTFLTRKSVAESVSTSEVVARIVGKVVLDAVAASDAVSRVTDTGSAVSDGATASDSVAMAVSMAKSDPVTSLDSGSAYLDDYSIDYSPGFAGTTAAW